VIAPDATASKCQAQQVTPPTELQMALPHSHKDLVFLPHTMHLREVFSCRVSTCPWYMEGMHLSCTTAAPVATESLDRLVTTPAWRICM
jgi:hypothetical protein